MSIRCGTLTMRIEEKGCHANCAMGAIEPTREYWFPLRPVSSWRPKIEAYPSTDLSRILKISKNVFEARRRRYLKEVDIDKNCQDDSICLPSDPFVLFELSKQVQNILRVDYIFFCELDAPNMTNFRLVGALPSHCRVSHLYLVLVGGGDKNTSC